MLYLLFWPPSGIQNFLFPKKHVFPEISEIFLKRFAFERIFYFKKPLKAETLEENFEIFEKIKNMWILSRVSVETNAFFCEKNVLGKFTLKYR